MTEQEWRQEFSVRLRRLSKQKKGFTKKKQLAEASGLSEKTIGRYRRGERTPNAIDIVKIANALDCTTDELIPVGEITKE